MHLPSRVHETGYPESDSLRPTAVNQSPRPHRYTRAQFSILEKTRNAVRHASCRRLIDVWPAGVKNRPSRRAGHDRPALCVNDRQAHRRNP
jgi:hypothetical protein